MQPLKLPYFNWERDAVFSLTLAIFASLYQVTPQYSQLVWVVMLLSAAYFGILSIVKQIKSSKAKVVPFTAKDWQRDQNGEWILTIASEIMLFRIELPDGTGKYHEVIGDVRTNREGTLSFVYFSGTTRPHLLEGRVVIR